MARFGKKPVEIPQGVEVTVQKESVSVKGPKGTLNLSVPRFVHVETEDNNILVSIKKETKKTKTMQGTIRSHLSNMVTGVTEGWSKKLEVNGTGYRAELKGKDLGLMVGFSHPVTITPPAGIEFKVEKNVITIDGADKEVVGQVAANIRKLRPPEPYKGAGIKYIDEIVRRKAGKQATGSA